jgi:hypothetical protein
MTPGAPKGGARYRPHRAPTRASSSRRAGPLRSPGCVAQAPVAWPRCARKLKRLGPWFLPAPRLFWPRLADRLRLQPLAPSLQLPPHLRRPGTLLHRCTSRTRGCCCSRMAAWKPRLEPRLLLMRKTLGAALGAKPLRCSSLLCHRCLWRLLPLLRAHRRLEGRLLLECPASPASL